MTTGCQSGCAYCNENRKGRTNHKGHWGYRRSVKPYVIPFWEISEMKKPTSMPSGAAPALPASGVMKTLPTLHQFLFDGTWDDGTARELPTLLFFADMGKWKVCVSDRALSVVAFTTGESFEDLLRSVEKGLKDGTLDWRPAKHDGGKGRRS